MMIGAKPKTEPTARSNSPAVISSVIPKVIMPSSGVKANKLLMLLVERKAGDRAVKTRISTTNKINGPNSGEAIILWRNAGNRIWCAKEEEINESLAVRRLSLKAHAKRATGRNEFQARCQKNRRAEPVSGRAAARNHGILIICARDPAGS